MRSLKNSYAVLTILGLVFSVILLGMILYFAWVLLSALVGITIKAMGIAVPILFIILGAFLIKKLLEKKEVTS